MQFQNSENISTFDRVVASFLVAFAMFIISYTAIRVYLTELSQISLQVESNVIPHSTSLWSDLGSN